MSRFCPMLEKYKNFHKNPIDILVGLSIIKSQTETRVVDK